MNCPAISAQESRLAHAECLQKEHRTGAVPRHGFCDFSRPELTGESLDIQFISQSLQPNYFLDSPHLPKMKMPDTLHRSRTSSAS